MNRHLVSRLYLQSLCPLLRCLRARLPSVLPLPALHLPDAGHSDLVSTKLSCLSVFGCGFYLESLLLKMEIVTGNRNLFKGMTEKGARSPDIAELLGERSSAVCMFTVINVLTTVLISWIMYVDHWSHICRLYRLQSLAYLLLRMVLGEASWKCNRLEVLLCIWKPVFLESSEPDITDYSVEMRMLKEWNAKTSSRLEW